LPPWEPRITGSALQPFLPSASLYSRALKPRNKLGAPIV
jgi:hypothetical protein